MTVRFIDGRDIAAKEREQIRHEIASQVDLAHRRPCLAVILVGDDPASQIYVNLKKKACAEVGIESRDLSLSAEISFDHLAEFIVGLNNDPTVDAILLQLPLPRHLDSQKLISLIAPEKDVDGLTPINQGRLVCQQDGFVPCTPLGVMKLIESTGRPVTGCLAAVVGRSLLVGAPIATMLSQAGATVITLHSKSQNCAALCSQADLLVVATGVHHLVDEAWVKPGAVIIDVGIHRTSSGNVEGDVNAQSVMQKASFLTPVPGGVGPMTIAMLLANCVKAYKCQLDIV